MPNITIVTARDCRRSRKIVAYLEQQHIPFTRLDFESPEGQVLAAQHDLRASPGIIVDGRSINPFDLLIRPQCRVNEAAALVIRAICIWCLTSAVIITLLMLLSLGPAQQAVGAGFDESDNTAPPAG